MDLSDKGALEAALGNLSAALSFALPQDVKGAYLRGTKPSEPGYEKLFDGTSTLPAIAKYMLVAESYLAQPNLRTFYDIFRAARMIPLLRALDRAIAALQAANVSGLPARLQRLGAASDLDDFDAILFELVVAARYGKAVGLDRLEFVPEDATRKTPDLRLHLGNGVVHVECKRIDRMTDAHVALTNEVQALGRPVLERLREADLSAAIEVTFRTRPADVSAEALVTSVRAGIAAKNEAIEAGAFTLKARRLEQRQLKDYALFPSPEFLWKRYAYRPSDWHGLVHGLEGTFAGPSFLDIINWDSALMWRVESDDLLWASQRLPFTRFFEGIEQLAANGEHAALHVWFERSAEHGHRRAHLLKLSDALVAKSKDFDWIIANETFSDVSVGGRFDFQEHANALGGTLRKAEEPLVMNVFVEDGALRGVGEWGVGLALPPIDEEPWSDLE